MEKKKIVELLNPCKDCNKVTASRCIFGLDLCTDCYDKRKAAGTLPLPGKAP